VRDQQIALPDIVLTMPKRARKEVEMDDKTNVLYDAAKAGELDCVEKLLQYLGPDARLSAAYRTPLAIAARFPKGAGGGNDAFREQQLGIHLQIMSKLLKAGADITLPFGLDGSCSLHEACAGTHGPEPARLLITYAVNSGNPGALSTRDMDGKTPLHWTCLSNPYSNSVVAELLLKHGVCPSAQDNDGNSPLHDRDLPRHVMDTLLSSGADPNLPNCMGETPLHRIASSCDGNAEEKADKVQALLDHGADPHRLDKWGRTAGDIGKYRNPSISAMLANAVAVMLANAVAAKKLEDSRVRITTVHMALHPRLGVGSPINVLDPEIMRMISDICEPDLTEQR
jgi:hypothetical protein